jgi:hypothetical protein
LAAIAFITVFFLVLLMKYNTKLYGAKGSFSTTFLAAIRAQVHERLPACVSRAGDDINSKATTAIGTFPLWFFIEGVSKA